MLATAIALGIAQASNQPTVFMSQEGLKLNHNVIWNDDKVNEISAKEWLADEIAAGKQQGNITHEQIVAWIAKHRAEFPIKTDWMRVYSVEEAKLLYFKDMEFVLLETPQQRTKRIRAEEAKAAKLPTVDELIATPTVAQAPAQPVDPSTLSNAKWIRTLALNTWYDLPPERVNENMGAAARQNGMKVSVKLVDEKRKIMRTL